MHRAVALLICSLQMSGELDLALRRLVLCVVLWERSLTSELIGERSLNSSGEEKEERLGEGRDVRGTHLWVTLKVLFSNLCWGG